MVSTTTIVSLDDKSQLDKPASGTIQLDDFYCFNRFNQSNNYVEQQSGLVSSLLRKASSKEHVFINKEDKTKLHVNKNEIRFNNTEQNYQAALDIAQDKGWKVIAIKGGNKEAKAEIWFQAQMRGLETKAYKPTKADQQRLAGAKEREKANDQGLDIRPNKEKLSEYELFRREMKEILIEAARLMDMDDKQINILENTINEKLAQAKSSGKIVNTKNLQNVQKNLPTFRDAFQHSVQMEQKLVEQRKQRQNQQAPLNEVHTTDRQKSR